jgi:hypothetical protein
MKNLWLVGVIAFALVWVFGGFNAVAPNYLPGDSDNIGVASLAANSGIGTDIKKNEVASFDDAVIRGIKNKVASFEDLVIRNNKVASFEKGIISKNKHSIIMEAAYFDVVWSNKNKVSTQIDI